MKNAFFRNAAFVYLPVQVIFELALCILISRVFNEREFWSIGFVIFFGFQAFRILNGIVLLGWSVISHWLFRKAYVVELITEFHRHSTPVTQGIDAETDLLEASRDPNLPAATREFILLLIGELRGIRSALGMRGLCNSLRFEEAYRDYRREVAARANPMIAQPPM